MAIPTAMRADGENLHFGRRTGHFVARYGKIVGREKHRQRAPGEVVGNKRTHT